MRITVLTIALSLVGCEFAAAAETSPAKQYQMLLDQYEQEGGARAFAKRFIAFAEQYPREAAATDALLWVVENVRGKSETTQALDLLARDHVGSVKLGPASKSIAGSRSTAAERLLRKTLEKNPAQQVRAQACFYLAALLDLEASLVEQLETDPELAPRVLQYYGKEYGQHLTSLDAQQLTKQREQVYERLLNSFADVEIQDTTMGKLAEKALFAIRHLSVGSVAPEITGQDIRGKPFKLSEYRGKVVMLSFWGHW